MWPFGKGKKNKTDETPENPGKTDAQRALIEQMRGLRAEIGEENLKKMAEKLKLEDLKKKVRHDIENDETKRDRLLDELKFNLHHKEDDK
jgi:hypothetical protein